jgi:hypothetical protein
LPPAASTPGNLFLTDVVFTEIRKDGRAFPAKVQPDWENAFSGKCEFRLTFDDELPTEVPVGTWVTVEPAADLRVTASGRIMTVLLSPTTQGRFDIRLAGQLKSVSGRTLGRDVVITAYSEKEPLATAILLDDPPLVSKPRGTYAVESTDKTVRLEFAHEMNRQTVEDVLRRQMVDCALPPGHETEISFGWESDRAATVSLRGVLPGRTYRIDPNGARTLSGEELRWQPVLRFHTAIYPTEIWEFSPGSTPPQRVASYGRRLEPVGPNRDGSLFLLAWCPGRPVDESVPVVRPVIFDAGSRQFQVISGYQQLRFLQWASDGRRLLAAYNRQVILIDPDTGDTVEIASVPLESGISGLAMSPSGDLLAIAVPSNRDRQSQEPGGRAQRWTDLEVRDLRSGTVKVYPRTAMEDRADGLPLPVRLVWTGESTVLIEDWSGERGRVVMVDAGTGSCSADPLLAGRLVAWDRSYPSRRGRIMVAGERTARVADLDGGPTIVLDLASIGLDCPVASAEFAPGGDKLLLRSTACDSLILVDLKDPAHPLYPGCGEPLGWLGSRLTAPPDGLLGGTGLQAVGERVLFVVHAAEGYFPYMGDGSGGR